MRVGVLGVGRALRVPEPSAERDRLKEQGHRLVGGTAVEVDLAERVQHPGDAELALRLSVWIKEGELTAVVVEVLGPEVVDVEHPHRGCEVGVPVGRHVHAQCQSVLGLGGQAMAQRADGAVQ